MAKKNNDGDKPGVFQAFFAVPAWPRSRRRLMGVHQELLFS
jgi:hypothetical protein